VISVAACFLAMLPGAGDVVARLHAEPAEVAVGEPCSIVLEIEHPEGSTVRLPEIDPVPDESWVLVEPRRIVRGRPVAGSEGRVTTIATWRVLSLDPGDRPLSSIAVDVGDASGTRRVEVAADTLHVRSVLAAGEDAPRPLRGFPPAPLDPAATRRRLLLVSAAALVLLAAAYFVARRLRRKPAVVAAVSDVDRLLELQRAALEDPESSRRVVYALCALLRGSVDRFLREDRAALVDAEWAARLEPDERVPLGVRRSVARILRDSERIKYALHAPTRFALEEMLAGGREALEALAIAPPPAAPAQEAAA